MGALTQVHALVVNDAAHAHTAENTVLTQVHELVVDDAAHAHTAENVGLDQQHTLVVGDSAHSHGVEAVVLTQVHVLSIDDGSHSHTVDNVALVPGGIVVGDVSHGHTVENVVLTQDQILTVADASHGHAVESVALTQAHALDLEAVVAFDAASTGRTPTGDTTAASVTFPHMIGGEGDRLLVVFVHEERTYVTGSPAVSYDGTPMAPVVGGSSSTLGPVYAKTWVFYLLDVSLPAAGAHDVVVQFDSLTNANNSVSGSALSFSGVAQQPREAVQAGSTTFAPYEVTVTPATIGAWIIEGITGGQPRTSTPTRAGQTERTDNPQGNVSDGAVAATSTTLVTEAVPTTVGWTFDGSMNRTAQVATGWQRAPDHADALHGHTADNVVLVPGVLLAVADVAHAHTVEPIVLGVGATLVVNDVSHGHTVEHISFGIGLVWAYVGGVWVEKPVKVYVGVTWVEKPLKFHDGVGWVGA